MKAEELRFGNLVLNNDFDIVTEIKEGWQIDSCDVYYKPIPLTEEWLIKFGFKCNGWNYDFKNYVFHAQGKNKKGEFFNTEFGIKNNGITFNISYNLEFVHQLQNLYFALTNKKLKNE
jgi:hypothetical protein